MPHRRTFDKSDVGSDFDRNKKNKVLFRQDGTRIGNLHQYTGDEGDNYGSQIQGLDIRDRYDAGLYKSFVLGDEVTDENQATGMGTYTDPKTGKVYLVHGSRGVIDRQSGDYLEHSGTSKTTPSSPYRPLIESNPTETPHVGASGSYGYDEDGNPLTNDPYELSMHKDVAPHWSVKKGKHMASGLYEGDIEDTNIGHTTRRELSKKYHGGNYDYWKNVVDMGEDDYIRKFIIDQARNEGYNLTPFQVNKMALENFLPPKMIKDLTETAKRNYSASMDALTVNESNKHLDYNKDGKLSKDEYLSESTESNRTQRKVNRKLFDSDRSVYSRVNPETGETEWFTTWSIGKLGGKERKISEKRAKFIKKKMHKRQDRVYGGE